MKRVLAAVFGFVLLSACATGAPDANDLSRAEHLVNTARETLGDFSADPDMGWFRDNVANAQGVMIIPQQVRGGLIWGGSGGSGLLLRRDERRQDWSSPAFYSMGSVSFGLQAGAEVSEIILLVMTQRAMDSLLTTDVNLGADASVAAGPVGAGVGAQTVDIIAYARSAGIYGGLSVEGAVISVRDDWNAAYYGRDWSPRDILIDRRAGNRHADPLRHDVARVAR